MARVLTFHRSDLEWVYEDEESSLADLFPGYLRRQPEFRPLSLSESQRSLTVGEFEELGFEGPEIRRNVAVIGGRPAQLVEYLPQGLFAFEEQAPGSAPVTLAVGGPGVSFEEFVTYVPPWEARNRRRGRR